MHVIYYRLLHATMNYHTAWRIITLVTNYHVFVDFLSKLLESKQLNSYVALVMSTCDCDDMISINRWF